MKLCKLLIAACLCLVAQAGIASERFLNLTPAPKELTVGEGDYRLPRKMTVAVKNLPAEMAAEAARFVADLNAATGMQSRTVAKSKADLAVKVDPSIAPEGYRLDVTQKCHVRTRKRARRWRNICISASRYKC